MYDEKTRERMYRYQAGKGKETTARLSLYLTPEDKEMLAQLAEKTGESKAALIRRLITEEKDRVEGS